MSDEIRHPEAPSPGGGSSVPDPSTANPKPQTPNPEPQTVPEWTSGRRLVSWALFASVVVLLIVILVFINIISARLFVRYDWTVDQEYVLSPATAETLRTLSVPVEVAVLELDPRIAMEEHGALERLKRMLDDYKNRSPRFTWESLQYGMDKAVLQARVQRLKLQTEPANLTVVVFANDRSKTMALSTLYEMDWGSQPARIRAFNAESALTAAIRELTGEKPPVVHFAVGHGATEGATEGGAADDPDRIRWIARRLTERENMEVKPLNLLEARDLPEDCKTIVIHRPSVRYGEKELTMLRAFLQRGGRLCVMVDALDSQGFAETGLEGLLAEWGVRLGRNVVLTRVLNLLTQREVTVSEVVVDPDRYGSHPVVDKLKAGQYSCKLEAARTVEAVEGTKAETTPLITLADGAWAETSLDQLRRRRPEPDGEDPQADLVLARAAKAPAPGGAGAPITPETRLVVFGSASFITDRDVQDYTNEDLFVGSLLWLMDREKSIGIGAKTLSDRRVTLDETKVNRIFLVTVVVLPGLSALLGLGLWLFRRR
jgi:ABC-2 type transport system permease protein